MSADPPRAKQQFGAARSRATQWPRGLSVVGKLVELAILNPREARKELAYLKATVERGA